MNPAQCGGRPCIRGMRIRVIDVLHLLASGMSREEILADYPELESEEGAILRGAIRQVGISRHSLWILNTRSCLKLLIKRKGVLSSVRDLTAEEWRQYQLDLQELVRVEDYLHLIGFVKTNHLELEREIGTILSELYVSEGQRPDSQGVTVRVNLRLLNFLGAMRLFLDHTDFRLSRGFGKKSQERVSFRERTRQLYSRSFAYRFLYKMRNFAQHCGMPIGHVGVTSYVSEDDSEHKDHRFQVVVRPRELIAHDRAAWGAEVARELEQASAELALIPLVREVSKGLSNIHGAVGELLRPGAEAAAHRVDALLEEGRQAGGELVAVGELGEPDATGRGKMDFFEPPAEMMKLLGFPSHRGMIRR